MGMGKNREKLKIAFIVLLCLIFVSATIYVGANTNKVFETDKIEDIRTAHYFQSRNLMYKDGIIMVDEDASRKNFTIKYLDKTGKEINSRTFTNLYTTYIQTDGEYLYLDISDVPPLVEVKDDDDDETYYEPDYENVYTSIVKLNSNLEEVGRVKLTGFLGDYYDMYYLLGVGGGRSRFFDYINSITGRFNLFHFYEDGSTLVYAPYGYEMWNALDEKVVCKEYYEQTNSDGTKDCRTYDYDKDADGNLYGDRYLLIDKDFKTVQEIEPTKEQKDLFKNNDYEEINTDKHERIWYSISHKDNYTLKAGLDYDDESFSVFSYYRKYYNDEDEKVKPEAVLTLYDGETTVFNIQNNKYERFYNGEIMDDYIVVFAQNTYDDNIDTLTNDVLVYDFDGNLVDTIKDMTAYNQMKVDGNSFVVSSLYTEGCKGWVSSTEGRPNYDYDFDFDSEDNSCVRELSHLYYKYDNPEEVISPPTADIPLLILIAFGILVSVALVVSAKKVRFIH